MSHLLNDVKAAKAYRYMRSWSQCRMCLGIGPGPHVIQ